MDLCTDLSCGGPRNGKSGSFMGVGQPTVWINDLLDTVKTGDIFLFSSKHTTSNITKYWTGARWDHIGVVVKPSPNKAYIIEWGNGLFACELVDRLNEYAELDAIELVLRQLKLSPEQDRRHIEGRMEQFVDMLFRDSFGQNTGVLRGAFSGWTKSSSYSSQDVVIDDLTQLFCSKTVAVVYKAAGLIAPNRLADKFVPKHFAERWDGYLELQGGASLGPQTRVTFESRRLRDAVSNLITNPLLELLLDPLGTGREQDRAARVIEKFIRRLAARRELTRRRLGGAASDTAPLYKGARRASTKERSTLLRRASLGPRSTPQDLQLTWMDEDAPFAKS